MKFVITFTVLLAASVSKAVANVKAEVCEEGSCSLERGCRCSDAANPIAEDMLDQYPQLISLTFNDAITERDVEQYWGPLLYKRVNPDGEPIGATFFVPHLYTDYIQVNQLYIYGFEIGVHSISKNSSQEYWRTASQEVLEQEFVGQKQIISKFARIPADDITGVRTPQLQLEGNFSFRAYDNAKFVYDSSWPTSSNKNMFPYTLDYLSTQDCNLGSTCPTEAFPGFWVLPINNFKENQEECNMLLSCRLNGTTSEIAEWLLGQIETVRTTTKTPLTLLITAGWFQSTENSWEALNIVLDELSTKDDVFFVSQKQVVDWSNNPVRLSEFVTDFRDQRAACNPSSCELTDPSGDIKYMKSCVSCPASYPWLGNPNGDSL